ncbi:unnamed protein product [Tilletia controversa]|uniref:Pdp3-interacting factor 1 n=3 Tax=Tilletia TaxID=13289 RepID=A0A8X7MUM9_9BASI|nr:hypothetical protein CF336_g1908 [Tilletia laevis]KAE8199979.1 hypothetical protein CF328_g3091 [Tilletia controversa]KAE8262100.1 hypothetical protein A4X03_0g2718 [Tilletia caries]KAE8204935.1 hypothetical protein CF335_g2480 [Tilletia laevis]KAE8248318.1 hypothetical protein A4X06_0g3800 [Tilletia controversa]
MAHNNVKYQNAPFLMITDFDGTITLRDSNDFMVDTMGMGYAERRKLNDLILKEDLCFRDGFRQMLASVNEPFDKVVKLATEAVKLDPGFKAFFQWAKEVQLPVVIVSSGMTPIIRSIMSNLIGEEDAALIDIVSNDVKYTDAEGKGTSWEIVFRHPENPFGHDKSLSIKPYRELQQRPTIFFAGDGVSDMSAARHADCLFVKDQKDNDLAAYCRKNEIPFKLFKDWTVIRDEVKKVLDGDVKAADIMDSA